MKRPGRWLFNFMTAGSLLMCVAAAVLWPRSYFRNEGIGADRMRWPDAMRYQFDSCNIASRSGVLSLSYRTKLYDFGKTIADAENYRAKHPGGFTYGWDSAPPDPRDIWPADWHGFAWKREHSAHQNSAYDFTTPALGTTNEWLTQLVLPSWAVLLITAILPAAWICHRRSVACLQSGERCQSCGYDLRATPDRCPECGAIPPSASGATI